MKTDTFRITGTIYFLFGVFYLVYHFFAPHAELLDQSLTSPNSPTTHRRVLINRLSSCSGNECSSLYFLSGIYDVVSMDVRFTKPLEEEDFETVFSNAAFSEPAYARVSPFSEVEFYLSSQKNKKTANNIGGSYTFDDITNGSAIIVTSEFPGREVWMFSDRTVTATCSGSSSSAVIFGNALNDGSHLFTMNPEGSCQKLEMDTLSSPPLTYCQSLGNFTWHVFLDNSCSSQAVVSHSVAGSLGTVYCVVIGDNSTAAELVCLSAESPLFDDMRDIKDTRSDDPPLYLRRYMQIVGGSTAGSILAVIVMIYVVHVVRTPVIKFREGDIVAYRLSATQQQHLEQKRKGKNPTAPKRVKNKGFAIVVRNVPPPCASSTVASLLSMDRWHWGGRQSSGMKGILQLQPLKRVVRPSTPHENADKKGKDRVKDDLFSSSFASNKSDTDAGGDGSLRLKNQLTLKEAEAVELTVDSKERPLSTNYWGIRGGRVVAVFPNVTRKKIRLPPILPSVPTSSNPDHTEATQRSTVKRELGLLTYLDNVSTQQLLTPYKSQLRRRKVPQDDTIDEEFGKDDSHYETGKEKKRWPSNFLQSCFQRLCGSSSHTSKETREVKRCDSRGIGWGGEEDMFLLDSSDFFDPQDEFDEDPNEEMGLLQPYLLRISKSKSIVGSKAPGDSSGQSSKVVLQEAYSYVLHDLPDTIGGEKLHRIHLREWIYPYAEDEKKAEAKKIQKMKLLREHQQSEMHSPAPRNALEDQAVVPITEGNGSQRDGVDAPAQTQPTHKPKSFRERSSSRAEALLKQLQDQQGDKPESISSSRRISNDPLTIRRQQSASPSPTLGAGYKSDMPRVDLRRTSTLPSSTTTRPSSRDARSSRGARLSREARSSKRDQQPVFTAPRRLQGTILSAPTTPLHLPDINQPRQSVRMSSSGSVRSKRTLKQQFSDMSADADREVQVGPNTVGMVMAGSKLERDDDDEELGLRSRDKRSKGSPRSSKGGSSGSDTKKSKVPALSSPRTPRLTVLPPVVNARQTPPPSTSSGANDQDSFNVDSGQRSSTGTAPRSVSSAHSRPKSRNSESPRSTKKELQGSDEKLMNKVGNSSTGNSPSHVKEDSVSAQFQLDLSFMKDE